MHDKLFDAQKDLSTEVIVRLATEVGGDAAKVEKAVREHTHSKEIDADADFAEDFKANGTPHFFIDGRRLVGAQPIEKFEAIIDQELSKAQAAMATGTPRRAVYERLVRDGTPPPDPERKTIPGTLAEGRPTRGLASAKVVIHGWADFECRFSKRVQPTLTKLLKEYGDRVKIVWHDLPLASHPNAARAAQAGREAMAQRGATAFWSLHDLMFEHQDALDRASLDGYASSLQLDPGKWGAALDTEAHLRAVLDEEAVASLVGATGTPTFVIARAGASSGYLLVGAQSYAAFEHLVRRALSDAK